MKNVTVTNVARLRNLLFRLINDESEYKSVNVDCLTHSNISTILTFGSKISDQYLAMK